jgi:hypothetical protein
MGTLEQSGAKRPVASEQLLVKANARTPAQSIAGADVREPAGPYENPYRYAGSRQRLRARVPPAEG